MSHNYIARSAGLYKPGEFDLGIHNPDLIQPDFEVDCGSLTAPDAYYNYAIELTRNSNLDRDVSEERSNPLENRVKYNKMADIQSGVGPRSSVRDLLPSTELLQEVGPPKHEHKPNFEALRPRLYEAAKKRLRRYENVTNIIESPIRRDMLRYTWNLNPRLRGQVQLDTVDNELTYVQNHTAQNNSFNNKLLTSVSMETDLLESKIYTNKMNSKITNPNIKSDKCKSGITNDDITMDIKMNKPKEIYNKNKRQNLQIGVENFDGNERTTRQHKKKSINNTEYNRKYNQSGVNSDLEETYIDNKLGRFKQINTTDKKNRSADFEYQQNYDNRTNKNNNIKKNSKIINRKDYNIDEYPEEETYKLDFRRPKQQHRVLMRENKNMESINLGSDPLNAKHVPKKSYGIVRSQQRNNIMETDDITLNNKVLKHG